MGVLLINIKKTLKVKGIITHQYTLLFEGQQSKEAKPQETVRLI